MKIVILGHVRQVGRMFRWYLWRKTLMQGIYGRIVGSGHLLGGRSWQGPLYFKSGLCGLPLPLQKMFKAYLEISLSPKGHRESELRTTRTYNCSAFYWNRKLNFINCGTSTQWILTGIELLDLAMFSLSNKVKINFLARFKVFKLNFFPFWQLIVA